MILGVGLDLVYIPKVKNLWEKHGAHFLKRCFHPHEAAKLPQNKALIPHFLAKRFAAKEAFAKALGRGIGRGINLQEIGVYNDALGRPHLKFEGETAQTLKTLRPHPMVHLSLSDERDYAAATVIISQQQQHHA